MEFWIGSNNTRATRQFLTKAIQEARGTMKVYEENPVISGGAIIFLVAKFPVFGFKKIKAKFLEHLLISGQSHGITLISKV